MENQNPGINPESKLAMQKVGMHVTYVRSGRRVSMIGERPKKWRLITEVQ